MSIATRWASACVLACAAGVAACSERVVSPETQTVSLTAEWTAPDGPLVAVPDSPRVITARVLGEDGSPVVGLRVAFVVLSGGGALSERSATTDAEGRATVIWSFGSRVGDHRVRAFVPSITDGAAVTYEAEVILGPPAQFRFSLLASGVQVGRDVPTSIEVLDAGGNAVPAPAPVVYSSADEALATISAVGVVSGVSEGITVVTATSGALSDTALVRVGPYEPTPNITTFPGQPSVGIAVTSNRVVLLATYTSNELLRRDGVTSAGLPAITLGGPAYDVAASPDGTRAYATAYAQSAIYDVNLLTGLQERAIPVPTAPLRVLVSADGSALFYTDFEGFVHRVNLTTLSMTSYAVPVSGTINGIALSPDGLTLAISSINGAVARLDAATLANPVVVTVAANAQGLSFSPDGASLYVASENGSGLKRLDAATLAELASTTMGNFFEARATANGLYVIGVRSYSGGIDVLDAFTLESLLLIPNPENSRRVAVEPVSGALWITSDAGTLIRLVVF